ncbi:MAG: apolipoprotein N-acyltransferase [bacterium]|nr:apolipoprotein N-acyltransferase [bacterium]
MNPLPLPVALVVAGVGGLLANLAFPQFSWWWMAPVALGMLFVSLHGARAGRAMLLGTLWGFAFFGPLISWALVSVRGHWLPWFALSLLQAVFVGLFAVLYAVVARRQLSIGREALVGALLWVAIEQLRGVAPFGGFPWGNLAFSQVSGPLLSLAPWGGTVVVGLVVAFAAAALAGLVVRLERPVSTGVSAGIAAVLVASSAFIPLPSDDPESGTLEVALVQASVPSRQATWEMQGKQITADYRTLTEQWAAAGGSADVVLWPESSADFDPRTHPEVMEQVVAGQAAAGVPLVYGTQRFPGDDTRFNEYLVWTEDGQIDEYAKQHPVPFGEYMPFRDFFRSLSSAVDRISTDMASGTEPGVLEVPVERLGRTVLLGVGICFEVVYDEIIRENVLLGAEFTVIPTNNASFGHTQEAFQQRDMTRFRAVEHGRATMQVATTGVSAVYAPSGTMITGSSDQLYSQWYGEATIPLRTSMTATALMGGWPRIIVWGLAAIWVVAALASTRRTEET